MNDTNGIDDKALDSLSVAPAEQQDDAGSDPAKDIERAEGRNTVDATLDRALDESMDASDPPANTQPGNGDPAPSSGYQEEAERQKDA